MNKISIYKKNSRKILLICQAQKLTQVTMKTC